MDWTPWIGRRRPVEHDALRILTIVHQLGEPVRSPGLRARVVSEARLQSLDHLVRQPVDLAYALIDHAREAASRDRGARGSGLARDVRRLLPAGRRSPLDGERLRPPHGPVWERWDDVLAYLGCRDLLRVRPERRNGSRQLAYLLTDAGADHLERTVYPKDAGVAPYLERCHLIRDHLLSDPLLDEADLPRHLREVGRRLEAFRRERLAPEEDLLRRWFRSAFGEPL